jgi:hypothetical protein
VSARSGFSVPASSRFSTGLSSSKRSFFATSLCFLWQKLLFVEALKAGQIPADGSTHTPGRLTFNDTWYPGWKMTVNGDERPPLRADFGLSAVDETLSAAPATDRPDWLHCHGLALAFFRLNQ